MDRFWLKNYPAGVPADIDPSLYPSVVALIEESFANIATPGPMSAWTRR